jgi:hypothetical protein
MVDAIREYGETEEKRGRLRRGALQAWDEYQGNGRHVTGENHRLAENMGRVMANKTRPHVCRKHKRDV